jgi:hypothetical protein
MLPLLFALIPAATRLFQLPETFHLVAFLSAVPISAYVMRAGYLHHGIAAPAIFGAIGLIFLGAGALGRLDFFFETGVTVIGSTLLAIGHLRNWRLRQSAQKADFERSGDLRKAATP